MSELRGVRPDRQPDRPDQPTESGPERVDPSQELHDADDDAGLPVPAHAEDGPTDESAAPEAARTELEDGASDGEGHEPAPPDRPEDIAPVETPYGPALQDPSDAPMRARLEVSEGARLWRAGTMGRSQGMEAQFWALEHPAVPEYGDRYGVPPANLERLDFVESATLVPGTPFVTREAPGVDSSRGGGIEVVVPPGGVRGITFSTVDKGELHD